VTATSESHRDEVEKFIVLSDGHLLQSYVGGYDPLKDFATVLHEISKLSPDFLVLAGDLFDKKKTETSDVRHPEGEEVMMKVRDVFRSIGIPIYSIRGNHEDERILQGLGQTIENFHYVGDKWQRIGNFDFYFMNTRCEAEFYDEATLELEVDDVVNGASRRWKERRPSCAVLVCHEWFSDEGAIYPRNLLAKLAEKFDFILDGHMHFFAEKHLGLKNLVCLPSLLPSRLPYGKYWTESYSWAANNDRYTHVTRDSPFGFVEFKTDTKPIFHAFDPSVNIINIEIDVGGLELPKARARLKQMFDDVDKRPDVGRLILLPAVVGETTYSPILLEDICRAYDRLNIQKLRDKTRKVSPFAPSGEVRQPILTLDQLKEEMLKTATPELMKLLRRHGLKLAATDVREILKALFESPYVLQRAAIPVNQYVSSILESIALELQKRGAVKEVSADFATFLSEQCKEAALR